MINFSRSVRGVAPLLLLTLVTLQLFSQAVKAADRNVQRQSTTELEPEIDQIEEELNEQLEEPRETSVTEALTSRPKRQFWSQYKKRTAVVLPLLLVAMVAVYVAAGYAVTQYYQKRPRPLKTPPAAKEAPRSVPAPEAVAEVTPTAKDKPPVESSGGLAKLLTAGRRIIPAATALSLAAGVVGLVLNQTGGTPEREAPLPPSGPPGGGQGR